jgi:hypothetical protein
MLTPIWDGSFRGKETVSDAPEPAGEGSEQDHHRLFK